jgi:ABC-type nitrate/sulfonate/bicarbonate transport system substrate-binding protein
MTTRRDFLTGTAALGAALVASPAVLRAQAREAVTVMTPFGFISDFIEMMNAVSGGHFAAQGLDVKLIGGQGTASAITQLIAGQVALIRASSIDQMQAVAKSGSPLVCVSTLYQASTFHMISLRDKPIRTAEELKGKTVGIVSVGGTTEIFLDLMLQKVGLRKEDAKREVTGNSPGALQILQQGRVDCFMAAINVVVTLQRMNAPIEVWSTDKYAPMPSQGYVVSRQTMEQKPDTILKLVKGLKASVDEMIAKPTRPIFERAGKDFEIPGLRDMDSLIAVSDAARDRLWLSEGRENLMRNVPRLWEEGASALKRYGVADVADVSALYTNRFIDQARG